MANETFNAGIDYFGLESATSNALKVKSSSENRTKQSTQGANTYGDTKAVDSWGDTAAPTAEYEVTDDVSDVSLEDIGGSVISNPTGFDAPLCFGGLSFSTSSNNPPTMTANGQLLFEGATRLRVYTPVAFQISPRHRAQNCIGTRETGGVFVPAVVIKKGMASASDIDDYGLESVSGDIMPIEFTIGQPKGVTKSYDLHGGTATATYTMNWYASTAPTISLSSDAISAGFTMSAPVTKSDPEGGYTQYTWTVSLPMVGSEYVAA